MLFLNDLGVLEEWDPAVVRELAFQRHGLARVFGELIVHRFVIADDQISFSVAQDSYRSAAFDAFSGAARMFFAGRIVIGVAHQVDDFAGERFLGGGIEFFFARFLGGEG